MESKPSDVTAHCMEMCGLDSASVWFFFFSKAILGTNELTWILRKKKEEHIITTTSLYVSVSLMMQMQMQIQMQMEFLRHFRTKNNAANWQNTFLLDIEQRIESSIKKRIAEKRIKSEFILLKCILATAQKLACLQDAVHIFFW